MNKEKFINWIEEKTNKLLSNMPLSITSNDESKAYMQGVIATMDEIKNQVESGKFD